MRDRRRWVEWGKNILIVLLTLSAGLLLSMTPLVRDSGLLEMLRPEPAEGNAPAGTAQAGAVLPARLAVYRDGERFGLQYDDARMEELFAALSPLLGDGLAGAGEPGPLTEQQWRECLRHTGIYFDFSGGVPLAALARWLGGGEECALSACARRVVLAAGEDDGVALCWQDAEDGAFYTCPTALSKRLHLEPALGGVNANGAYFAFEDGELGRLLAPYTLIAGGELGNTRYSAAMPLANAAGVEALLDALSFNSQNHAPGSSGEVYLDGVDRLVVRDGRTAVYRAARGEKYPVGIPGEPVTAAQAADGARALAERAMAPLCGDARLYLIGVQPEGEGWRVQFGYRLNGCGVYLYEKGWAAEFVVRDGFITEFVMHLRSYAAEEGHVLLLPIDKAAVLLPDLTKEKRELVLQYRDGGGQTVSPGWEAV